MVGEMWRMFGPAPTTKIIDYLFESGDDWHSTLQISKALEMSAKKVAAYMKMLSEVSIV